MREMQRIATFSCSLVIFSAYFIHLRTESRYLGHSMKARALERFEPFVALVPNDLTLSIST
jgi:hypothetical protein